MRSTRTRLLGAAAVTAFITASTVCAAPAAQADGGYYGSWTLTTFKLGKKTMKCNNPPNDEGMCAAGMTLDLRANYRYKSTIKGFDLLIAPGKGAFVTATVTFGRGSGGCGNVGNRRGRACRIGRGCSGRTTERKRCGAGRVAEGFDRGAWRHVGWRHDQAIESDRDASGRRR